MQSKFDLVLTGYNIDTETEKVTLEAIKSYKYYFDEVIYSEDGGRYSPLIMSQVDCYLYNWKNKGFTVNVNRGWRYSTGDYTALVSNDTYLREGDPRSLCIPGKVTSPIIVNQNIERLAGMFFVVPKEVKEKRGLLMEEMAIYSSDSEYDHRTKDIFQSVPSVKVYHHQAFTVTKAGVEGGAQQEKDRKIYQQLIKEGRAAS